MPLDVVNLPFSEVGEEWKQAHKISTNEELLVYIENMKKIREFAKISKCAVFINYWHAQEYESDAMWKLYLASSDGICIQSTYQKLRDSFDGCHEFSVNIGMVNYKDYDKEMVPFANILYPVMTKRISFEHEKELRALVWTIEGAKGPPLIEPVTIKIRPRDGIYVPVDLDLLVEKIYVAPTAPDWIFELVKSISAKFGLEKDVTRSSLSAGPNYL